MIRLVHFFVERAERCWVNGHFVDEFSQMHRSLFAKIGPVQSVSLTSLCFSLFLVRKRKRSVEPPISCIMISNSIRSIVQCSLILIHAAVSQKNCDTYSSTYQHNNTNKPLEWIGSGLSYSGMGTSVSCSSDGKRIVSSEVGYDSNRGKVALKLKQWDKNAPSHWSWAASTWIYGKKEGDFFGLSTSISGSGQYLAIGAPGDGEGNVNAGAVSIYQIPFESAKTPLQKLVGVTVGENFGFNTALNEDGSILVVVAPFHDGENGSNAECGSLKIYYKKKADKKYSVLGTIYGDSAGDNLGGGGLALSSDGSTVAVHSPNAQMDNGRGKVSVYDINSEKVFSNPIALIQNFWDDNSKLFVHDRGMAISRTGAYFAVQTNELDSVGQVKVYEKTIDAKGHPTFSTVRDQLSGSLKADWFGRSIHFSNDHKNLIIGQESNVGKVSIYAYNTTAQRYNQDSDNLVGEAEADGFGASVAVSEDGTTVLVGAFSHRFYDRPSGITYIFEQICSDPLQNSSVRQS